jgi:hypothetical protein
VSRWLGHKSLTTTVDLHGHLVPEASGLARDALDKAFAGTRVCAPMCPRMPPSPAEMQVRDVAAGEPACRPGSVHPPKRADGHPSWAAIADSLMRSTREHRAGRPQTLAQSPGTSRGPF